MSFVGKCIAGVEVAIRTMRTGEVCKALISSAYAHGELGCPPRIPPNSACK